MNVRNISWIVYFAFVGLAIAFNGEEHPFVSHGPYPAGKICILDPLF